LHYTPQQLQMLIQRTALKRTVWPLALGNDCSNLQSRERCSNEAYF
jgi:hypothetical protein